MIGDFLYALPEVQAGLFSFHILPDLALVENIIIVVLAQAG